MSAPGPAQALAALAREGYEVLDGVPAHTAARLRAELVAYDRRAPDEDVAVSGAYRRVWGIIASLDGIAELVTHGGVVEHARRALGPELVVQNVCAHVVGVDAPQQFLHADQQSAPLPWDRPTVVTAVWMLERFSEANGATRVCPGTHRANGPPPYGQPLPPSVPAEGEPGQVLVLDGRVWHHAGANPSAEPRFAVLVTYASPIVSRHPRFAEGLLPVVGERIAPLSVAAPPRAA